MMQEERQGVPPQEELAIVTCQIPKVDIEENVAYYIINVHGSFNNWSVRKRYSQFEDMNTQLTMDFALKGLPKGAALPPKEMKLFQSHLSPAFIEKRRVLLENYLKKLVSSKETAKAQTFLNFLTSDRGAFYDVPEAKSNGTATHTATGDDDDEQDDAEVTGVTIPATRTMSDHVLYQIDVCNARRRKTFSKWTVLKRFGQFYEMDTAMRACFANDPEFLAQLPSPPERRAKLFNDHMDPTFIEQRRALLEAYLQKLVAIPQVVRNIVFLQFLGVSV